MKRRSANPWEPDEREYRDRPRTAVIIVEGAKGDNRLIRKILTEEIKRVIGRKRWTPDAYQSAALMSSEIGEPSPARFYVDVTDAEFNQIMAAVSRRFIDAGWPADVSPIDAYHD